MNNTSQTQVEQALIDCLKAVADERSPDNVQDETDVLKEWDIDSEDGIDVALDIGPRLGIEIPLKENPLIEEDGTGRKRARTFREVVNYLLRLPKSQPAESNNER